MTPETTRLLRWMLIAGGYARVVPAAVGLLAALVYVLNFLIGTAYSSAAWQEIGSVSIRFVAVACMTIVAIAGNRCYSRLGAGLRDARGLDSGQINSAIYLGLTEFGAYCVVIGLTMDHVGTIGMSIAKSFTILVIVMAVLTAAQAGLLVWWRSSGKV